MNSVRSFSKGQWPDQQYAPNCCREAAEYLLPRLLDEQRFLAVYYYCPQQRQWMVLEKRGRCLPRHLSPIAERQAFVIYDDARCRGADLQLRQTAVGLLTLGPQITKGKLMQAAGRLRQLGRGQSLCFVGTADVSAKISQANGAKDAQPAAINSQQMVQWVMSNTVQAMLDGVYSWSKQGMHFAASKAVPELVLQDEVYDLETLYSSSRTPQPVGDVVHALSNAQLSQLRDNKANPCSADMEALITSVRNQSSVHGAGHAVMHGRQGANEECERELEAEAEEEQEVQREVPRLKLGEEQDWAYEAAFAAASVGHFARKTSTQLVKLPEVTKDLLPTSIAGIAWSERVYCTSNFLNTVTQPPGAACLNEYLRPLDAFLLFPQGDVVLLSERDAEGLLEVLWSQYYSSRPQHQQLPEDGNAPLLVHLCYATNTDRQGKLKVPRSSAPLLSSLLLLGSGQSAGASPSQLPWSAAQEVSMRLFNGETTFHSEAQRDHLRTLVYRKREVAEALVGMRGKHWAFLRSDLERAVED